MDTLIAQFKKGYKTTEFWAAAVTGGVILTEGATSLDLDNEGIIGLAVTVASYILSRGYLKAKRVDAVQMQVEFDEATSGAGPFDQLPPVA